MSSCSDTTASGRFCVRTQPWLGTYVSIAATGGDSANPAVQSAFELIANIHRSMSFQSPCSELSDLNRLAHQRPVTVSTGMYRVLRASLALAGASEGCFDPTVAGHLVQSGLLPAPSANGIDESADWRDVHLLSGLQVQYRRPLWLDLGGIAKGYALDRAVFVLKKNGVKAATVNAGGDIRSYGHRQTVTVRNPIDLAESIALLELEGGAVATSGYHGESLEYASSALLDAATGRHFDERCSVTVSAPRAIWADALTKIVLARRQASIPLLKKLGASAMLIFLDGSRQQIN